MTVDFMAILLEVGGRARQGARFYFCKVYANFGSMSTKAVISSATPRQATICAARPQEVPCDERKTEAKCADVTHISRPQCWAAGMRAALGDGSVAAPCATKTKAARVDDACRRTADVKANLTAPFIARSSYFSDGLMRGREAGWILDDPRGNRHEWRGARQTCANACTADNGGHCLAVEFHAVSKVVDEKSGHGVFAEEAGRYDRSLVSSALADGVKCAEVSSHYKYRKSVLCLPADMGRRH
jgi:hypothetical protein